MVKLIREREMLSVRGQDGKPIRELSVFNGFPALYVDDLVEFVNSKGMVKEFIAFVLEKRKRELEERKRELDGLIKLVEEWEE